MTRRGVGLAIAVAACLIASLPAAAHAQGRTPRYELSAGALFGGGYTLGSRDADLIRNQTGGPPYTLFQSSTRLDSAPGF